MKNFIPALVLVAALAACASTATSAADAFDATDAATTADAPPADAPPADPDALVFPDGFLWGVAMSAFQTEGGAQNDWTDWIAAGSAPAVGLACDSLHRWQEDIDLAASLGVKIFRISIEWARVEPEQGKFDEESVQHYHEVAAAVRAAGMEPLVTLHHFTNPKWVAAAGGWASPDIVKTFPHYAGVMAGRLGDVVDLWNPQNESMVYISGSALVNSFPGGKFLDLDLLHAMFYQSAFANAAAVDAIRAADKTDADGDGRPVVAWLVHATSPTYPADPADPASVTAAANYDYFYNLAWVNALLKGDVDLDFNRLVEPDHDFGGLKEGNYPALRGRFDVLGINYYNREFIVSAPGTLGDVGGLPCLKGLQCGSPSPYAGDNGNEIYPPGLYRALKEFAGYGLPLAVTENGVADADDHLRPAVIVTHLEQVHRAISEGVDVRAYLHWSLLDNYEWADGYTMKFGLFAVDFDTFKRTPRGSVQVFGDIVRANAVSGALRGKYAFPDIVPSPGD